MKIACFGDLHAHNYAQFDKHGWNTKSERLDRIIQTLAVIREYCVANNIRNVLFAGDLFEVRARVNTFVQNATYDEFKRFSQAGIRILGIPGNHDEEDNSDVPQHSLHMFDDIENVKIVSDLGVEWIEDDNGCQVPVVCVPYSKNTDRMKQFITDTTTSNIESPILLGHLGVNGAFVGGGSYPMAEAFTPEDLHPEFFQYVVLGHFHRRQFIGGKPNAFYCGAPIQHSFSDEGEDKGFYIIDTDKRCNVGFVPIPNPKFVTLKGEDLEKNGYETLQEHANAGNYIRAQLKENEVQAFISHAPVDLQYKIEHIKVYEEQVESDVQIGMSFKDIIAEYTKKNVPEGFDLERLTSKGLSILDSVKDR
jgi:DNA repair exonuclease SbcCD nuclease subunit